MPLETEVKFYIGDLGAVAEKLQAAGAILHKPRVHERNLRFDTPDNGLTAREIVLRLRQDDRVRLTYKAPSEQQSVGSHSRLELETGVSDFDSMAAILEALGFQTSWVYEKYRSTYTLDSAEIVLDEMPFGGFIEIEGGAEAIERVITALDLTKAPRILASYAELFEGVKAALGLPFRDLTFPNFEGLSISPEIFYTLR